ncbi:MAG: hypothetical protein Q4G43_09755 [Mobilicoccus sp.]|nr:hypothetical protein [Mobilicoccus sp.]
MNAAAQHTTNSVVLERFRHDLGPLWTTIAPLCRRTVDGPDALLAALHSGARDLSPDLEALLAGWTYFDEGRRAVLTATVTYLAGPADGHRGEVVDDEQVVSAAVRAILSGR